MSIYTGNQKSNKYDICLTSVTACFTIEHNKRSDLYVESI